MLKKSLLLSCVTILFLSTVLAADNSIDDDLSGFDNEDTANIVGDDTDSDLDGFDEISDDLDNISMQEEPISKSIFRLSGDISFKTSVGYKEHEVNARKSDAQAIDYSGVNQARTSLYLQLDARLSDDWKVRVSGDAFYDAIYNLHPNNNYNTDTLDAYKTQLRFNDTYIQGRLSSDIDLKVGRQIVVWGKSDSIRITDVINPTDNRQPGMTDIEDLRLPTTMAKLDYYVGKWNLSAMAIAESRIFLEAAPRSEFFPVDKVFPIGAPDPFIELIQPSVSWDNMQYAFAANGIFSGWDLSFYAADLFDQKWHIDPISKTRVVTKIKMLGSAFNVAIGSWLVKTEIAYLDGVKYNSTTDEKNRLDLLIGFDYMGIEDTVLSLEIANKHIYNYESQMSKLVEKPDYVYKDEMQTAIRVTKSLYNDTLSTTALLSVFGSSWQYGGFARVWAEYELADAIHVDVGIVDYIDGDKPFPRAIKDNDRIFADITYSF
ncbi:MAG: DUF1302 family protein [Campylobacterota bacterium]|nr:DUF1302 family protein [Campylobacterota bacterium]